MKKLAITTLALVNITSAAFADHVDGYYRSNGTYVNGYERSAPNGTVTDNYSYQGNTNPYTGQVGTNRYEHDTTSPYYNGPDSNGKVGHPYGR
jgi:hypothetical protein